MLFLRPEEDLRQPVRAVELASQAVELVPTSRTCRNTLGIAQYRAGDWDGAIRELRQLASSEGTSFDFFFLAKVHWQRGGREEALSWYSRGVEWMKLHGRGQDRELLRFRAEAEEWLDDSTGQLE